VVSVTRLCCVTACLCGMALCLAVTVVSVVRCVWYRCAQTLCSHQPIATRWLPILARLPPLGRPLPHRYVRRGMWDP
jgi:hypothetical protein